MYYCCMLLCLLCFDKYKINSLGLPTHVNKLEAGVQHGIDPALVETVFDNVALLHRPRGIYHEDDVLPHDERFWGSSLLRG